LTFNIPKLLPSHSDVAIKAAIDIDDRFAKLKRDWLAIGKDVSTVFSRIAIASGPVHYARIGHSQQQALTCFFPVVNISMCLCGAAPREQNVIVFDESINPIILSDLVIRDTTGIGKAEKFVDKAYYIEM